MDNEYGTPDAVNQEQVVENLIRASKTKSEERKKPRRKPRNSESNLKLSSQKLRSKQDLPTQEAPIRFDTLADNLSVLRQLEDEEVTELQSQAKELGVDPVKFAKSPAWKAHLESLRTKKKNESRTPEPSYRTAVFEGKTFGEVVGDDKSSDDQKQRAFEAQRDALLKRGRNQMI